MRFLVVVSSLLMAIQQARVAAFSVNRRVTDFPGLSASRLPTVLSAESLTLYGHPGTRSPLVNWACHELGVDFEMGDLSKNPHPFGQLPCLAVSDGSVLFESGAILQYLNIEHASKQLTKQQLASVMSWITWANASLDGICFKETPDGKVYDTGLKQQNKRMLKLEEMLGRQDYLVNDAGFTLADVAVASYLLYVVQFFPDVSVGTLYPNIAKYMQRCASRDAYARAFGDRVQQSVLKNLEEEPPKKLFGVF